MLLSTNENENVEFKITPIAPYVKIGLWYKNNMFHLAGYYPGMQFEMFDVFASENLLFKQQGQDYLLKLKDVTVEQNYDFCSFFIGFVSFLFTQTQTNE